MPSARYSSAAERQAAQHDLKQTEPENVASEPPQLARMKFQPDDEQQQRNANFGDAGDLLRVLDKAEQLRSDQRTGDDVAEGRAEPQLPEQSHEYQRRAEHDRAAFEDRGGRLRGFRGRRHRADSIAASSARNGSMIAPWPPSLGRAGSSAAMPGPPAIGRIACEPVAQRKHGVRTSSCVRPRLWRASSAAEACPKAQAWTCIDSRSTLRSSSSCTARLIRLPQVGERSSARPSSRSGFAAHQRAASRKISGVQRLVHSKSPAAFPRKSLIQSGTIASAGVTNGETVHSRRHVVPPGPSSSTMPSALSSSRMRSAVAKSRFFLASARVRRCGASMSPASASP